MNKYEVQRDALQLPPRDRLDVAEALWESLDSDLLQVHSWQREILEERMTEAKAHPEAGESWDEVKKEVQSNLHDE